jgi:hypothetical protein
MSQEKLLIAGWFPLTMKEIDTKFTANYKQIKVDWKIIDDKNNYGRCLS